MSEAQVGIERALALAVQARDKLDRDGSFRARVLIDMLLIELRKDLKKLEAQAGADLDRESADDIRRSSREAGAKGKS